MMEQDGGSVRGIMISGKIRPENVPALAVIVAYVELKLYLQGSISVSSVTMQNPANIDVLFFIYFFMLWYKTAPNPQTYLRNQWCSCQGTFVYRNGSQH